MANWWIVLVVFIRIKTVLGICLSDWQSDGWQCLVSVWWQCLISVCWQNGGWQCLISVWWQCLTSVWWQNGGWQCFSDGSVWYLSDGRLVDGSVWYLSDGRMVYGSVSLMAVFDTCLMAEWWMCLMTKWMWHGGHFNKRLNRHTFQKPLVQFRSRGRLLVTGVALLLAALSKWTVLFARRVSVWVCVYARARFSVCVRACVCVCVCAFFWMCARVRTCPPTFSVNLCVCVCVHFSYIGWTLPLSLKHTHTQPPPQPQSCCQPNSKSLDAGHMSAEKPELFGASTVWSLERCFFQPFFHSRSCSEKYRTQTHKQMLTTFIHK